MPRIANDLLTGTDDNDVLSGIPQEGNAFLVERIFGLFGDDRIEASQFRAVSAEGNYGSDTLIGSFLDDTLAAGGRNTSTIFREIRFDEPGVGIKNELFGGPGDDVLYTSYGDDSVEGGLGDDTIQPFPNVVPALDASAGFDTLRGGAGEDAILGGTEADIIDGQEGDDLIFGGGGIDTIRGGKGNDRLIGDYDPIINLGINPFVRNLSRFPDFIGDDGDSDNIKGQAGNGG